MLTDPTKDDELRLLLKKVFVRVVTSGFHQVEPDWRMEPRLAQLNRMYWILDGEGSVEVDGVRYDPPPGSLVILPAGSQHAYSTNSENRYTKYWCQFEAKIGDTEMFQLFQLPIYLKMPNKSQITQLFEQLHFHFWHRRRTSALIVRAAMFELLAHYFDLALDDETALSDEKPDSIQIVIRYMEDNLARRILIEELADLVHYHPNYFIRYFHSITGRTPLQYMKMLRIEASQSLLRSTTLPVASIAVEVGIDPSNFPTLFKQQTSCTPSQYREKHRQKQL